MEFLKPNKRKLVLTLLLPMFWLLVGALILKIYLLVQPLLYSEALIVISDKRGIDNLSVVVYFIKVLAYLFESLLNYPFACSIVLLYDYYQKNKLGILRHDKTLLLLIVTGILVFNSISLEIIARLIFIGSISLFQPQYGLKVVEVYPDSPVLESNRLREGDTITRINNVLVENVDQAIEISNKLGVDDSIWLDHDGHQTEYWLIAHENFNRGYLGIKVRDASGREAIL